MTVSLEDQIKCVRRELAMRQRAYPKWIAGGRMKQEDADKELAAMQAVHDTLTASVGAIMDTKFKPTRADLEALRTDADAVAKAGQKLMLSASVAPAVLYLSWPNMQHNPADEESSPYRCISINIPLPPGWEEQRAREREGRLL